MHRREAPAVLESEIGMKPEIDRPNSQFNISGPVMYEYRGPTPGNSQSRLIGGPGVPTTFMDFASTHTLSTADDDSSSQYVGNLISFTTLKFLVCWNSRRHPRVV